MKIYAHLFLGFYCLIKKILPKESNAEAYAIGLMSGAVTFLYFAATLFFMGKSGSLLETAGVFFVVYAGHHLLFVSKEKYKAIEAEIGCSNRWIYYSLWFFFTALFLLVVVSEGMVSM